MQVITKRTPLTVTHKFPTKNQNYFPLKHKHILKFMGVDILCHSNQLLDPTIYLNLRYFPKFI